MRTEDVTLTVGGSALRGFQEINVTRSAKDASIPFAMKATNPSWTQDAFNLRLGAAVQVRAGADLMADGYIDDYAGDHGEGGSHEVRVSGRSKSQDAVDCPPAKHKTGRVEKKTLLDAAKEFDEFGVGFTADVPLKPIDKIQRNPNETVFDTLERYARRDGLLLMGEPDGKIKITRAGEKRIAGALVEGQPPIKSFKVQFTAKDKRSPVVARGQRAIGVDKKSMRQEVQEYDSSVGRYRPVILFVEGDADDEKLRKRAKWESSRRSGESCSVSVTVFGWRDSSGKLWEPGRLMAIYFPSERLDQDMTLSTVTFKQTIKDGTVAELEFCDPRALGGKDPKGKSDKAYSAPETDGNLSGQDQKFGSDAY